MKRSLAPRTVSALVCAMAAILSGKKRRSPATAAKSSAPNPDVAWSAGTLRPPRQSLQRLPGRTGSGVFAPPSGDAPLVFSHSGKIGDLVFALPFCRAVAAASGRDRFAFHIRTDTVIERIQSDGVVMRHRLLDKAGAELFRPLLERQPYISSVSLSPETPAGAVDLDFFRVQTCLPLWGNSLPNYYLPLAPWLAEPPDLSRPWLFGGRETDLGGRKIAIFLSSRYPSKELSFGFLEPIRDELVFLGTKEEHEAFASAWFPVEHRPIRDFADALDVLSSVRLAIGNQTGFYSIAEGLKIPRLLVVSSASPNVVPCGGAFQLLHVTESAKASFLAFHERFCR